MTPKPLWFTLPAATFLLVGCQSAQTTAAHKIADALPRALGPAAHYDVSVEGDTFALGRGRAARIHVVGQGVRVAPDATLDTLDVDARGLSFDPAAKRLKSVDSAVFTGTVGQQYLDRYLVTRHPDLRGLTVRLRATDVSATLAVSVAGLHTQVSVSGTLAPDGDRADHLDFIADAASVGRLDIPPRLVNGALSLVNPVFDLSQTKVPLTITRSEVRGSTIVLQGKVALDGFQAS